MHSAWHFADWLILHLTFKQFHVGCKS